MPVFPLRGVVVCRYHQEIVWGGAVSVVALLENFALLFFSRRLDASRHFTALVGRVPVAAVLIEEVADGRH